MKNGTTYAILAAGAAVLWWRSRPAADPHAEVVMTNPTPTGMPARPRDNPLSDDEAMAIKSGKAYLNKNGWLTYVGYDAKAPLGENNLARPTTSGGIAW